MTSQYNSLPFNIKDILYLLHLPVNENKSAFNISCPFCDDTKKHMNIDTQKNTYHCTKCDEGGGMLKLYAALAFNQPYSKQVGKMALNEIEERLNQLPYQSIRYAKKPKETVKIKEEYIANDDVLHETYRKLLQLKMLKLTKTDYENLLKRGLSEKDIMINEYASLPPINDIKDLCKSSKWYSRKKQIKEYLDKHKDLFPATVFDIIAGVIIAQQLVEQGATLKGVPGFFRIGNQWCFKYVPGIVIPIRNTLHQIISLQIRTNIVSYKYMTVSSKNLDSGTAGKSRVHKVGSPFTAETLLFLTEGPLKADTALALSKDSAYKKIAFLAIPGVNSIQDLNTPLQEAKKAGIKNVMIALDMDRLTNKNVRKAMPKLQNLIKKQGLNYKQVFWDIQGARKKANEYWKLLQEHNITFQPTNKNIFYSVCEMAKLLENNKITFDTGWIPSTKGIDDFLFLEYKKRKRS